MSFVIISLIAANITAALRERVASLEDKIHNLYQILALQAILVIAILVYKSFSYWYVALIISYTYSLFFR